MVLSLSVIGAALVVLVLAVLFAPLAAARRRTARIALTSAGIVAGAGIGLMMVLFLGGSVSGSLKMDAVATIPLMAAIALVPVCGLAAVVFGILGVAWPNVFDRPNDRFAANIYTMIAAAILVVCIAGTRNLHADWPGYAIALFSIPLVPMLTKKRLGPLLMRDYGDETPARNPLKKGEWAQPFIRPRRSDPTERSVTPTAPSLFALVVARLGTPLPRAAVVTGELATPPARERVRASTTRTAPTRTSAHAQPVTAQVSNRRANSPRSAISSKAALKPDITSFAVVPVVVPSDRSQMASAVPSQPQKTAPSASKSRSAPKRAPDAAPVAPSRPRPKMPATLLIPGEPTAPSNPEVVVIRRASLAEEVQQAPEHVPSWTNMVIGNITLEDGRAYSIAVRSTQTLGENDIKKLAKAD